MNAELFKADMLRAVRQAISKLDRGTVGISEDCLWQLTVRHISPRNAPTGTSAAWVARQTFNEVVSDPAFSNFVYKG